MYAAAGLEFPFFGGFYQEAAAYDGTHMGNMVQMSILSEYDLGGEGDLFKAPEPIIEESVFSSDPMETAMSIISGGDDVTTEPLKVADLEAIQYDHLLSDVYYACKKDLLESSAIEESLLDLLNIKLGDVFCECKNDLLGNSASEEPLSELFDIKLPAEQLEVPISENQKFVAEGPIQKSVSFGCLESTEWIWPCPVRPNFLDFQGLDFEAAFGIRRSYSEGDIQNLSDNNTSLGNTTVIDSSFERLFTINDTKTEERRQKLSRYRKKKTQRNFGRKIKYACRKALADSQPRVRGRFAKS
ncbi:uncharacterized protein [Typha latifolia]|uniref:uncharacterized protein isoform X2 n=1 Tax=Typha latifolia TaxID=4733 RepID=UPI003C2CE87F